MGCNNRHLNRTKVWCLNSWIISRKERPPGESVHLRAIADQGKQTKILVLVLVFIPQADYQTFAEFLVGRMMSTTHYLRGTVRHTFKISVSEKSLLLSHSALASVSPTTLLPTALLFSNSSHPITGLPVSRQNVTSSATAANRRTAVRTTLMSLSIASPSAVQNAADCLLRQPPPSELSIGLHQGAV